MRGRLVVMTENVATTMSDICDPEVDTVAFVRGMFGRLGEKWSIRALDELDHGPLRFTALMGALPGISHRILTITLKTLENDGLVSRTAYPETPPRVEYALTKLGQEFLDQTSIMVAWLQDHQGEVEASRAARLGTA
jgi:DNA-binding HxlR family transcriptional regulator